MTVAAFEDRFCLIFSILRCFFKRSAQFLGENAMQHFTLLNKDIMRSLIRCTLLFERYNSHIPCICLKEFPIGLRNLLKLSNLDFVHKSVGSHHFRRMITIVRPSHVLTGNNLQQGHQAQDHQCEKFMWITACWFE